MKAHLSDRDLAKQSDAGSRSRKRMNRAEKAEATRARLFNAAVEIVGKHGYAATSVARITVHAEVAQGTFYNYFKSRQDLLDQLLPAISRELHARIKARVLAAEGPVGRERARMEAFFDFLEEAPHLFKILSEGPVQAPDGFRRHLEQQTESYRRAMAHERALGNLRITDPDELEVATQMLMASRQYLSERFCFIGGRFTRPPDFVVDAYMKFVTAALFNDPDDCRPRSRVEGDGIDPPGVPRRVGTQTAEPELQAAPVMSVLDRARAPTRFVDSDHPLIRAFAADHAGAGSERERAVRLYYAVRDAVRYDLTSFGIDSHQFVASNCLQAASAFCVPKAILLAAVARSAGIAARIGFADVRNHLTTPRIRALMDDDIFHWHAYTSLFLDGHWVKATPAFDLALCERHSVRPLDFDGAEDSIFHRFDAAGRRHMEYITFIGEFEDMPLEEFRTAMRVHHPRMLEALERQRAAGGA